MSQRTEDVREPTRASEAAQGMNEGMRVLSYLLSGVVLYGLLGWLGDHFLGTGFLLPTGIVLGAGLGVYAIIRRFGQGAGPATTLTTNKTEGTT